jgi:glycosyltransferase involved in cell wall biosynthesis
MIALICDGLARRGHAVTLMAARGSRIDGRLVAYPWAGRRPKPLRAAARAVFETRLALELARGPDAVLAFGRTDHLGQALATGRPLVYRFSNPIRPEEVARLRARARGPLTLVALSEAHAGAGRGDGWRIIPNGVDLARLTPAARSGPRRLAFLGRLTRAKGVDTAIRVARRAGLPLTLAGTVPDEPGAAAFFEAEVRPHLGDGVAWIGEVDEAAKTRLLRQSAALLMPLRWEEPFGIVAVEALACGTPVIATPRGAMPEVIRDGVTGYLAEGEAAMADAIARLDRLDRRACRAEAESRFSADAMVEGYLAALDAARAPAAAPAA